MKHEQRVWAIKIADFRLKNARYAYEDKGQYKAIEGMIRRAKGIDIADCRFKIAECSPDKEVGIDSSDKRKDYSDEQEHRATDV